MNYNPRQTENQKDVFELTIDFNDLTIDRREIEFTIGYRENKIPEHFSEFVDEIIKELPTRCIIRAGYRILEIKKSEWVVLFVCTIGPEMEKWSRQLLNNGDSVKGYLVDMIASITVESITDYLHDYIGELMLNRGLKITNRYSPGYCNWPVSEQHLLFSLLPPNFCGITLTDSALMVPIKSISGIIGAGHQVKRKEYICDKCEVKDCTYRAKRVLPVE